MQIDSNNSMDQDNNNEKPEYLYHYTSIDAMNSMLNTYRDNVSNENMLFWASSIIAMNDPKEMIHGKEVLKRILPGLERLFEISPNERLDIDQLDSEELFIDYQNIPFVLSFTENEDDLAMWTMYGDKGDGVMLRFKRNIKISQIYEMSDSGFIKVNYKRGIDRYAQLREIYNNGLSELRNYTDAKDISDCKKHTLGRLFSHLCPYIKSEAYEKENERRCCFLKVPYDKIKFRTKNKIIIPYIEVPIPIMYLDEIMLGPCSNIGMLKSSLRYLLNCCGLQRVNISESKIPYRNV